MKSLKNPQLILIGYYQLRESLYLAAQALKIVGNWRVINVPLMDWCNRYSDEIVLERWTRLVNRHQPQAVLWWYIGVSVTLFKSMNQVLPVDIPIAYFNWDEPHNWSSAHLSDKAPTIHHAFVCCQQTLGRWKKYKCPNVYYLLPGISPSIHRPLQLPKIYDISFVLTNTYQDPIVYDKQLVNRRQLIDDLYHHQDNPQRPYRLALYGPDTIKQLYPRSYVSFVNYFDLPKIISQSIINLNHHVCGQCRGYFNERMIILLACGAIILTDPVIGSPDILGPDGHTCHYLKIPQGNQTSPFHQQVIELLQRYDQHPESFIPMQQRAQQLAISKYTWKHWAQTIHQTLTNSFESNNI